MWLEWTLDMQAFTTPSVAKPNAKYHGPYEIAEVHARGDNLIDGRAYCCFYIHFGGNGGRMSGSITEGDENYRLVPVPVETPKVADHSMN